MALVFFPPRGSECLQDNAYEKRRPAVELPYEVLDTYMGAQLEGKAYVPLFDYFVSKKADGAFRPGAHGSGKPLFHRVSQVCF